MKQKIIITVSLAIILASSSIPLSFSQQEVPDWVKQTVGWYAQGIISEKEFLDAIRFLVQEKIILLEEDVLEDPTLLESEAIVTKPKLRQCEVLFQSYKNIGNTPFKYANIDNTQFKYKYSHINYLDSCISLYKDPIWKYVGTDRYEKLAEKLAQLEAKPKEKKLSYEPSAYIQSKIKIGTEKYLIKFNLCAGDKTLDKGMVLIKSQIEAIQVGSNKDVPANACRSYETQIFAKNPDNIFIEILEEVIAK